jgi:hypothetical protein
MLAKFDRFGEGRRDPYHQVNPNFLKRIGKCWTEQMLYNHAAFNAYMQPHRIGSPFAIPYHAQNAPLLNRLEGTEIWHKKRPSMLCKPRIVLRGSGLYDHGRASCREGKCGVKPPALLDGSAAPCHSSPAV